MSAPITSSARGVVDLRDRATSTSMTMNLGAEPQVTQQLGSSTLRIDIVTAGDAVYARLPSAAVGVVAADRGKAADKARRREAFRPSRSSSLGDNPTTTDPNSMLQFLRSQSGNSVVEGSERVDGTATTHYRAELSLAQLADGLPADQRGAVQEALFRLQGARRRPVPGRRVGGRAQPRSTGHHGPRPRDSERPVSTGNRDHGSQPLRSSASTGSAAAGSGHGPERSGRRLGADRPAAAWRLLARKPPRLTSPRQRSDLGLEDRLLFSGVARQTTVRIPGFGFIDGSCSDFNAGTPICSFAFHDVGRVLLHVDGASDSLLGAESPGLPSRGAGNPIYLGRISRWSVRGAQ